MAALKEKRSCGQRCEDFGRFVWNSDNGTLMGRTPEKWVYISLYYVAFYVVMTALFSLAIWTLMYTLDPYAPDYQDRLKSPGVMVWPDTYLEEKVQIAYNTSNKESWTKMVKILTKFLQPYNETNQLEYNNYTCTKGKYFFQNFTPTSHHIKRACPFTQSMLGHCSGLEDPTFGYNCSMPCVIIKMNRIIGFLPTNHTDSPPYVNCTVLDGHENVETMEYFPNKGIMDLSYFPYYGKLAQPTYVNPLVAVRFSLVKEKSAKIQCRVVSDKISYENFYDPFEGKVIFELKALK
ncbi:Potassium-transporting ATPase subunit beta [Collichthys lucidus]|uniref:Sodium/potassium-transporting ATPase subunit beta n=1 Tax=Collichthys lucidus TaxID=240159 RepID=A0A4U5U621_COLLU|nr:Potassium-transporting ATPase subunit beta [Collichthys lucidus]